CGPCGGHAAAPADAPAEVPAAASEARTDLVAVRRRGAGTDLAPNA
ncbi:biotin synthase BioB, partial [Streptomyces roseolus]